MTEANDPPNWDLARTNAPVRPQVPTGIPEEPRVDRPRRLTIAVVLATVATACFLAVLVSAVLHLEEIRESFITVLNENLEDDYDEDDKTRAVHIMLAIIGGFSLFLALALLVSTIAVRANKSAGARVFLIVLFVLFLPTAFAVTSLREENWPELLLGGVAALGFLSAAVLAWTRPVSIWLRQRDQPRSTPLTAFTDSSGNPIIKRAD